MIAATIGGRRENILSLAEKGEKYGADIIEIRLDKIIGKGDNLLLIKDIKKKTSLPIIATKRLFLPDEAIKGIISLVDYVDLEYGEKKYLIDFVKRNKKTLIISHHNYQNTPEIKTLISLSSSIEKNGADIVKIATFINNKQDIARLLNFICNYKKPIIAIGMGLLGKITRIIAPIFGSLITYGFINKPYADGQPSVSLLRRELEKYRVI
ncbi:MAG: type I 3-dehydroquinate dehydratase [bacterium]